MKVAVFYPTESTAWSITKGVCAGFSRLGHIVTDCGEEYNEPLLDHNLIFVSGPEYLWKRLRSTYPSWDNLGVPKVGWLHETVEREDYGTNPIAVNGRLPIEELQKFTSYLLTPAIQDQRYGLKFLPFGVDTAVFYPRGKSKEFASIYTGPLYKKRREFLKKYPGVCELSGHREFCSVEEYAVAISNATVVLSLPSLSEASNVRTLETLASKTALIAPAMPYPDSFFEHGKHLLYYQGSPEPSFSDLRLYGADKIAQQGYEEVLEKHTIEHRVREVLTLTARSLRKFSRKG